MNLTAVRQVIEVAAAVHKNSLLKRFKDYKTAVATSTFYIRYWIPVCRQAGSIFKKITILSND